MNLEQNTNSIQTHLSPKTNNVMETFLRSTERHACPQNSFLQKLKKVFHILYHDYCSCFKNRLHTKLKVINKTSIFR